MFLFNNSVLPSWNSVLFRKEKQDTTVELQFPYTVILTLHQNHSILHFIRVSVCCSVWLMDVFLDLFSAARDADEREKWIHALEGTILRHTLQQVRPPWVPH